MTPLRLAAALAVLALTPAARAQDAASPPAALSPEDQAALDKAFSQDQAARAQQGTTSAPAAAVAPPVAAAAPAPGGFSLQSLNPDISFIADVALAAFTESPPVVEDPLGGAPLNLQAGGHDPQANGFNLQQLELAVSKAVDPYFRFDANIVFGKEGVEIEEAYATTLGLPYQLQARVGQMLTRFGRLNGTHLHAWDFVDQPFIFSKFFGGEGNRGLGVELSWLTPLPWYVELVGSATEASGEGTTRSFAGEDPAFSVRGPADLQYTFAAKQFFPISDDLSLLWGLSVATGPNTAGEHTRSSIFGTDLYLKYRPLTEGSSTVLSLQVEWLTRQRQTADDLLSDTGGYAYLFWRFQQRWGAAVRWEFGSPATLRAAGVAEDPLDPVWTSDRQRVSANLTFWPTEFSRIRLQGSADFADFLGAPRYAALLAFEFAVGAHGAHAF